MKILLHEGSPTKPYQINQQGAILGEKCISIDDKVIDTPAFLSLDVDDNTWGPGDVGYEHATVSQHRVRVRRVEGDEMQGDVTVLGCETSNRLRTREW